MGTTTSHYSFYKPDAGENGVASDLNANLDEIDATLFDHEGRIADLESPSAATYLDLPEGTAPATPASGNVRLYAKTDGSLYQKDDAGTETGLVGGGGGGGGGVTANSFRATLGTYQTITNNTWVVVEFDTESWDTGSKFNTTTYRYTPAAGKVMLHAVAEWTAQGSASGTGAQSIAFYKNGTLLHQRDTKMASAAVSFMQPIEYLDSANGTDYYDVRVWYGSTTTNDLWTDNTAFWAWSVE